MTAIETGAVVARLLQFLAAAVLAGAPLFFLYGTTPDPAARWPSRLVRTAAGLGAAGTLGWLMAQAGAMGDAPADAIDPAKVWSVATGASFGHAALIRLGLFALALAAGFAGPRGRTSWRVLAGLGAAASASLAWTGHGVRDEGLAGAVHLTADVLHLLAASVWLGALAVLAALALRAGRGGAREGQVLLTGLVRFSAIGVAVVAVLVASGLVNSWFLVGPRGLGHLLTTLYGQVLVAKLALFGLMLGLAAANRYRHTPRLEDALQASAPGGGRFRPVIAAVLVETALAAAVLLLVSWMGTLSPAIEAAVQ